MPIEFYQMEASPPCRAVRLTAKHLDIDMRVKECNVLKGEHKSEAFKEINPVQQIPALVDGDVKLGESRAIMCYLANQYGGNNSSLYPSDPRKKAKVNAMLQFDQGLLYQSFANFAYGPVFFKKPPTFDPDMKEKLLANLQKVETVLTKNPYVSGDELTIADHAIMVTISTMIETKLVDVSKFSHIEDWFSKCKDQMESFYEEVNGKQAAMFGEFFRERAKENGLELI